VNLADGWKLCTSWFGTLLKGSPSDDGRKR
jgi:hypothetical protein